jgi:hypothetical protein
MTDAFERLKNRARPTVPPRDPSLVKSHQDELTEFSHSVNSQSQIDSITNAPSENEDLPEVVRRTVRLEGDIDQGLEQLCNREKITREIFLEAAYLVCMDNQQVLAEVVKAAKTRYGRRKVAGERRKFKTMEKKHRG